MPVLLSDLFESLIALNILGFLVPSSNQVAMLVRNNVRYSGHNRSCAGVLGYKLAHNAATSS